VPILLPPYPCRGTAAVEPTPGFPVCQTCRPVPCSRLVRKKREKKTVRCRSRTDGLIDRFADPCSPFQVFLHADRLAVIASRNLAVGAGLGVVVTGLEHRALPAVFLHHGYTRPTCASWNKSRFVRPGHGAGRPSSLSHFQALCINLLSSTMPTLNSRETVFWKLSHDFMWSLLESKIDTWTFFEVPGYFPIK
jgi:hypothetical protein